MKKYYAILIRGQSKRLVEIDSSTAQGQILTRPDLGPPDDPMWIAIKVFNGEVRDLIQEVEDSGRLTLLKTITDSY